MLPDVCFACVLRSTDISSNVVDISRGFEDLIPPVFEELCAGLFKTAGKARRRVGSVPCLRGPRCTASGATRLHCPDV